MFEYQIIVNYCRQILVLTVIMMTFLYGKGIILILCFIQSEGRNSEIVWRHQVVIQTNVIISLWNYPMYFLYTYSNTILKPEHMEPLNF